MLEYTETEVRTIFNRHGFSDRSITRSDIGFRNQVWIGEDAVLKIYGAENRTGQALETWFYKTAHPDFAPKLYAAGENWILMERIRGTGLYRRWRDMTDTKREATVAKIAEIALEINQIPLNGTESYLPHPADYGTALLDEIHTLAIRLKQDDALDPVLCKNALAYAEEHIHTLDDSECCLVYNDLHFDNLLVTEEGRIVLIDYEMMSAAPPDLVLDVWQRMMIHPFTYANEEDHPLTHPRDYRKLLVWMQKYVPTLFSHPQIRKRVNLYAIRYEFALLTAYPRAEWPTERLRRYLCECIC